MSKIVKKEFKPPNEPGHCMPTFTLEPVDGEVGDGERLETRAKIDGIPAPKVQWRKGNWLSIDDGGRHIVRGDPETGHYSMAIKSARSSDLGKYKVVAMNDYGEVTAFFQVKITAKSKGGADGIKVQLKRTERKSVVKKTQEELEKEVIEILKTADPKDYESICMQHGFYDFRYILHKLKEMKREEMPAPEFEAAKVLRGLRHIIVNDEGTAVFEIHMEQVDPNRQLKWLKDGALVQIPGDERRHELRRVGNVYQLIIRNVRPEDAGTYTLEVGEDKFTANLTIKERPLGFESELKNQKGTIKGRCVFECTITRRDMGVTWLKNGKEIHFGGGLDRIQAVSEGRVHKLIIMELKKEDAAKYTAKLDKLETTAELTVMSAPIRFRNRLVDTEVKDKATAYFECTVSNRDIGAQWFINGKAITSTGRYKIAHAADKHTLFIEKVGMADNSAKIEVRIGDASSSATLNVNENPIKVLKKMEDVKCRTGEKVQFTCEINDADQKKVKWFKDDKEIKNDKTKYEVVQRGGKHTLVVKSIGFEDEGHYTFQVRGVRLGANLACTNPPTIDKKFLERVRRNPLKFKAGTKARIVIPIISKEPMTISWTNGRVTLEERGRFHMENTVTEAVVEVQSCKIADSGDYELTIANENGDVTVAIPVKIVDKPNPPSGEIKFSDIEKDSVMMKWEEPVDSRIPVEKYIIEMQVEGSSTWKKVATVDAKQTNYKATGLTTRKKHKFRVKSSNEEGESEPLESDNVKPEAPDQPPKIDQKVIDQLANKPIVVNAGETASIRIPVQGNPPPSAAWYHNGEEVLPVKHHRAKKDSSLKEVSLQITKCNRTDNGDYEARIFNNVGGVLVKTKIIVNDVPAFKEGARVKTDKLSPKEVKLSWDAPEDDGNQPITGYEIEKALAGTDKWQKVGDTKAGTTSYTAGNCKPGESYVFRVKAKNSRGASQPINSSPVTCGSSISPPTIDPRLFDELTKTPIKIKAGQTGRLKVPLSGQPIPTATWSKDGESLEGTPAGTPAGTPSSASPSAPSGVPVFKDGATVKVDSVTRKEVKMSWEPVVDEGDQPLTGYDIEKTKPGSDKWEKVGETKPGTTTFTASSCTPGETYVFRVKAKNVRGASEPVTSAPVKTNSGPGVPTFKDGATVKVDSVTAKEVNMSWEAPDDDGDLPLSGYDIEKCKAGTNKWEKLGETKPKTTSFTASNCTPGETYVFRVRAKNNRGASEPVTSRPVTCGTSPGVPSFNSDATINFGNVTAKDVKMSWDAPEDDGNQPITGYEIEKSVYGTGKWDKVGDTKSGTTSFTASSCAPGETYLFRVKAKNNSGTSEPVTSAPVTCGSKNGVPVFGKDAKVKIDKASPKEVQMSWDRPANDGDQPITGYEIEKSKAGTNQWEKVGETEPGETGFTATNCSPGETYVFRVKAKNNRGTSEPVTSSPVTCKSGTTVPSFKDGATVKVDKVTPKEVKMSWDAPTTTGDQPLAGYDIERAVAGTDQWEKVGETKPGTTGFTAGNCAPGETYVFRVKARNCHGSSKPVTTAPVTTGSENGIPVFSRDATVKAENVSPKEVKMSWDAPANEGDRPVTGYEIEKSVAGTDKWDKVGDTKAGTTSFTASNCAPGETYVFRVKAKNARGPSKPVTSAPITCKSGTGVPTFKDGSKVKVDNSMPNKVKMTWDAPAKDGDQPISGYDIEKSVAGTDKWDKVGETKPGTTGFTARDCEPGETYVFRVKAKNCRGASKPVISAPVTCKRKPTVPSFKDGATVKVDKVTPKEVKMSWDAPTSDGDQPLEGYDIEKALAGTDKWDKVGETKPGTTGFTARNCAPGETYVFRVRAKNPHGSSKPVTTAPVTTGSENGVPVFSRDATVKAENVSPKEVKMSWEAPANGGDRPVTGYEIEKSVAGKDKWEKVGDTKPGTTSFTASNCAPGETYVFRVKAKNARGASKPVTSAPITCKSGTGVPTFKDGSKVKIDDSIPNKVKMTWDVPAKDGDQQLSGYDIEKSVAGTDKWDKIGDTKPGTTDFTTSDYEPGETYVFRVKAKNCRGASKPVLSAPVTCKRRAAPTAAPGGPSAVPAAKRDNHRFVKDISDAAHAQLLIHASERTDSGKFICRLKNEAGELEIPLNVIVVDSPKAPSGEIDFSDISSKGVTVSWKAPTDDGGSKIDHYVIEKKEEGKKNWTSVGKTTGSNTTSYKVKGVPSGKNYRFRIRAVNDIGEGQSLESEPVLVKDPFDAPSKIKGDIEFETATDDSISISWPAVDHDGGNTILGYYVEKRKKGQSTWGRCNNDRPTRDRKYTATGLRFEAEYEFRVIAVNAAGEGIPSNPSQPFYARTPVDAPGEPSDLELIDSTNTSLTLAWKGTEQHGGAELLGYEIEIKEERSDHWQLWTDGAILGTSCVLRGLRDGASYNVRMRSVNRGARSKYFYYKGLMTATEILMAPSFKMTPELEACVRDGFHINAGSTIRINVPYTGRPKPHIEWLKDGEDLNETVELVSSIGIEQMTIRSARGHHSGIYTICLTNTHGTETLKVPVKVYDVPMPPTGPLRVEYETDRGVTLSWHVPRYDGGKPIQGYVIQSRDARGRDWQTVAQNVRKCEYVVDSLQKSRSYYFRILSQNEIGRSEPLECKTVVYIKQAVAKVHIEEVNFTERDLRTAPQISVPMKPRVVPEGVKVTLSCSVGGKPQPTIKWFKDGKDISDNRNYFKENVIGLCRLVITHAKPTDAGVYKVIAENAVGSASCQANLIVET